jgi:hypothetical protein
MSTNALGTYLHKFKDWKFCPPSDHLWTVHFNLSARNSNSVINQSSIVNLYSNIINVNRRYNMMYSPIWKIEIPNDINSYISNIQDTKIGLFLASEVSFDNNSVTATDTTSANVEPYAGWLTFGKIQSGRAQGHEAKIKFFKSNWDINEILFDSWIAAIGQQGLIEDSALPNIKADIIINEYACSAPKNKKAGSSTEVVEATTWVLRKTITLNRAFPVSRDETNLSYNDKEAGEAKYSKVIFKFDSYQIKYADILENGYLQLT